MCGFAAIHHTGRSGEVREDVLLRMREQLAHRGPDGAGLWLSEDRRTGLAHRRLSIIDVAGGHQPMLDASGRLVLVCNGEIYNHMELRRELREDGARFATDCDVEVILHLYQRYGTALLDRLDGMFAFVIFDSERRRLFAARDRIGEKPLYFTTVGGALMLASEIKALLAHPEVHAEVDRSAVDGYFTHLAVAAPRTLCRGISKLPPGGLLLADAGGIQTRRYWSLAGRRGWRPDGIEEATGAVRSRLEHAVRSRLIADVPVGTLLSGGLDSTALVALAAGAGSKMRTFSVGFEQTRGSDERPQAGRVAEHFGCEHHEVEVTQRDALEFLPDLIHYQDEPLADPVCIPLSFVCGLARRMGTPVVLAGEGADELFWGYPGYERLWRRWPLIRIALALPGRARRALADAGAAVEHPYLQELLDGVARRSLAPMHVPTGLSYRLRNRLLAVDSEWLGGWRPDHAASVSPRDAREALATSTQEHEFELRLPELLLMRIDRFSMQHGVEARVPFLAPSLVEYCYGLSPQLKLHGGCSKLVLRRALQGIVPDWTLAQPKRGFGAPVASWMADTLAPVLDALLTRGPLDAYLDTAALRARLARHAEHSSGRFERRPYWLWPVLNFALWHYHWIEGFAIESLLDDVQRSGQARAARVS